ncbi:M48 family metallopeptidase [Neosynechococcus sphagnicola]|uniref:M48 family metallopeptidase n=1 Tax=Neosynechococcus sphagnicola TaxID=1501145 RepID=UPI001EF9EAB9|nr:M48 family metallopeptidase [Neosynechococcus sphagnicola]
MRHFWLYPLVALGVALGLIMGAPTRTQAFPWGDLLRQGIEVIRLSTISDRQEVALGQQINRELVGRKIRLYENPALTRYINRLGRQLAANSDRPNLPYRFQVVADRSINAFATMGGFVYVNTGLLRAADNEAQLASVLAHEIGHISSRHAVEQLRKAALEKGIATVAGLEDSRLVSLGVDLAINRPGSRQNELEADQKGLVMLKRSGYAPIAMVDFLKKLQAERSIPSFLSTHPATAARIIALQQAIDPATASQGEGLDGLAYKRQLLSLLES